MSARTPIRKPAQINPYNSTPSKPSTKPRHSTPLKTPLTRFTGSVQTNSPSPLSSSSTTPRKKRFVRKQPLKDRLVSSSFNKPHSYLHSILQWPSNFIFKLWVDWDLAHLIDSPKVARSIGFLFHLLSFLVKYTGLSSNQSNRQSVLKKSSASATARASAIRTASKRSVPWVWLVFFAIDKLTFLIGADSCFYVICCYSDQHLHTLHEVQKLQDVHEKGMSSFFYTVTMS